MRQQLIEEPLENRAVALSSRFNSSDPEERTLAQTEVTELAEKDIDLLLEILKCENKKKAGRFWTGFAFGVIVTIAINVFFSIFGHIGGAMGGVFSTVPMGFGVAYAPTKLQKRAAAALAKCDDIRAVAPLIGALEKQDKATIGYARTALIRLLPKLAEKDFDLLDAQQRAVLYKLMVSGSSELPHAIVIAMKSVGDSQAIPNLQKLIDGKGAAKKKQALRDGARDCLEAIQTRLPAEKARETLLRAANAPGAPEDILLRPAGSFATDDASTLLRPQSLES